MEAGSQQPKRTGRTAAEPSLACLPLWRLYRQHKSMKEDKTCSVNTAGRRLCGGVEGMKASGSREPAVTPVPPLQSPESEGGSVSPLLSSFPGCSCLKMESGLSFSLSLSFDFLGFWVHCNDSKLDVCSVEEVCKTQAYILFYTRRTVQGSAKLSEPHLQAQVHSSSKDERRTYTLP